MHGTRRGILRGLVATGGVITSAGLVLAATFAALGVIPILFLAQLAFIVAFGVLLDTFVVRSLLVPAVSYDIGRAIWWPSRLWKQDAGKTVRDGCRRPAHPPARPAEIGVPSNHEQGAVHRRRSERLHRGRSARRRGWRRRRRAHLALPRGACGGVLADRRVARLARCRRRQRRALRRRRARLHRYVASPLRERHRGRGVRPRDWTPRPSRTTSRRARASPPTPSSRERRMPGRPSPNCSTSTGSSTSTSPASRPTTACARRGWMPSSTVATCACSPT